MNTTRPLKQFNRRGKAKALILTIIAILTVGIGVHVWVSQQAARVHKLVSRSDQLVISGDLEQAIIGYREAEELCNSIAGVDRWSIGFAARQERAKICCRMGSVLSLQDRPEDALARFREAVRFDINVELPAHAPTGNTLFLKAKTEVLVAQLASRDWSARHAAAKELDDIDWQPPTGEQRARWLCALGKYDAAADIPDVGVAMLIEEFELVQDAELRSALCGVLLRTDDEKALAAVQKHIDDKLERISAIARRTLPTEAAVSTWLDESERRIVISGHLLEGADPDDTSPYVRGDYATNERLEQKAKTRCFEIYRAIFQDVPMAEFDSVVVECKHGVRVQVVTIVPPMFPVDSTDAPTARGNDQAMTIFKTSLTPEQARDVNWSEATVTDIERAWTVESNRIPSLQFFAVRVG